MNAVTNSEYALISQNVYADDGVETDYALPNGWERIVFQSENDGFAGALYVNDAKQEAVIAFRGTGSEV